ncbi:MAG: CCA tRNA nucleotidyltransferase [Trueperaceae bacterium]|nr:MAG: CCA tRNA nucleotidyltransferase [Trueperaceae bacterium]
MNRETKLDISQFTPIPEAGYLVGGAVRDALLGREFSDIDWLVAEPAEAARRAALELGGHVFALDEDRGHWRVMAGEVSRDYIHPEGDLETDLRRRDFTCNALAATLDGLLIDPCGGLEDLKRKRVRMVSREVLEQDPVRLLRGVRLAINLEFGFDPATREAIRDCAEAQRKSRLALPAWERSRDELDKILQSPWAGRGMQLLDHLGILDVYLPELALARGIDQGGFHHLDVLHHSFEALNQLVQGFPEADPTLRWATLLHDLGKAQTKTYGEDGRFHFYGHDKVGAELAQSLLKRLRQPNDITERTAALVRYHMLPLPKDDRSARRFVHRRRTLLPDLLKLMIADREAARGPLSSEATRRPYRLALARIIKLLEEAPPKPPLLDGKEVMDLLGLAQSPRIGEALRFIHEAEAVGDITNKGEAEAALQHFAKRQGWI